MNQKQIKLVLIEHEDEKSRNWVSHIEASDYKFCQLKCNQTRTLLEYLRALFGKKKPYALIIRYLYNDRSLNVTLKRLLSHTFVICLAKCFGTKLIWICHNVDKETSPYYHRILRFRRNILSCLADNILVTDKGLVPIAEKFLLGSTRKIDYLTFGKKNLVLHDLAETGLDKRIEAFVEKHRNQALVNKEKFLCFSVIGHTGAKYLHFPMSETLIQKANDFGYYLVGLLIGPFPKNGEIIGSKKYYGLDKNNRIFLYPDYIDLNEGDLEGLSDFMWRVYDDWSMSYTLYQAAELKKPVLSWERGFVSWAVNEYNMGAVIKEDFSNLKECLDLMIDWNRKPMDKFDQSHSWEFGSNALLKTLDQHKKVGCGKKTI